MAFEERPFGTLGIDACVVVGDAVNAAIEGRIDVDTALVQIHSGFAELQRKTVTS